MGLSKRIYLDHHATTPCDPRVVEAMVPYFSGQFGNPSSRDHVFGWEAEKACETARQTLAYFIGAQDEEILFTSGATESNNLALKGVAEIYAEKGKHIITTAVEHKSVLETARWLERAGFTVTYLPVNRYGQVSVEEVKKAVTPHTILISVMAANNEVGTLQPIAEIGKWAHEKGIFFHTDAAQAIGKVPIHVRDWNIDLMSFSAHKVYGPKGIGALFVRRENPRTRIAAQIHGGGQERELRSGTLNVPAIVGFGKSIELVSQEMKQEEKRVGQLRDLLHKKIVEELDHVVLNGHPTQRLAGNLNLSFAYVEAESLLREMNEEVAVSNGAACSSLTLEPSYVLQAMGVASDLAHSSLRFGVGRFNTQEEIQCAARKIVAIVKRLRATSPLKTMAQNNKTV